MLRRLDSGFILFHDKRHPLEMGAVEINQFLSHLATDGRVMLPHRTRRSVRLLFLYQKVLEVDPGRIEGVVRAFRPQRLPVVLTREEVDRVLTELRDPYRLISQILYGSGLRLLESLQPRVQDVDFVRHEILVRHGKGGKDRRTMLAQSLAAPLQAHLDGIRERHRQELARGRGQVRLPEAFERKVPSAVTDWRWQWVFPSFTISVDPRTGWRGRHHLHEGTVSREISQAGRRARLTKRSDGPQLPALVRHALAGGRL